jgi:hypothetical protein
MQHKICTTLKPARKESKRFFPIVPNYTLSTLMSTEILRFELTQKKAEGQMVTSKKVMRRDVSQMVLYLYLVVCYLNLYEY